MAIMCNFPSMNTLCSSGRETVVIGDNVSYIISSTGRVHAVEDPYYSSILSLAPREEFPPAPQQPLPPIPLTTIVKGEQETEKETKTGDTEGKATGIEDSQIQETTMQDNDVQTSEARVCEAQIQDGVTQERESKGSVAKETELKNPIYDSLQ